MEILLNGEKLDVSLEDEKNAAEVLESLLNALKKEDPILTGVMIDGNSYAPDDPALKKLPVEKIGRLELEASSKAQVMENLLVESRQMLLNISEDLKTHGFERVREYRDIFTWLKETIETINNLVQFPMVETKLLISTLTQIEDYLFSSERSADKIPSLASVITSLVQYLDAMRMKIANNFSVGEKELKEAVSSISALLPEISESFQTGRDREALDKINTVISVLELCCFYLRKNLGGFTSSEQDEIDNLYQEINSLLTQIVEAFENGDLVLLGDLLEYELPEKLDNYKSLVLEKNS